MNQPFRLIVVASRDWDDAGRIGSALQVVWNRWLLEEKRQVIKQPPILVLPGLSTPAGEAAGIIWDKWGGRVEYHPTEGVKEVLDLGADMAIAFIKSASPGATAAADLAENEAGVTVVRIEES
jgi:hypothetical protein